MEAYAAEGRQRHDRSNRKKRDGFIVDAAQNHQRAMKKAWKRLRKIRLV